MSLLNLQDALARLYTERAFREAFFADPASARAALPLTPAERRQLAALDRRQVEWFARSLKRKRLGPVRELLPAAAGALGDGFAAQFFACCDWVPPPPTPLEEALGFLEYLQSAPGDRPGAVGELLRCERLCLEVIHAPDEERGATAPPTHASRPSLTSRARLAAFRYDVEGLYPVAVRGELGDPPEQPGTFLFGKVAGTLAARIRRVNPATADLLARCDGTRTLAAIAAEVAGRLGLAGAQQPGFARECEAMLAPLVAAGLVDLSGLARSPQGIPVAPPH